MKTNKEIKKYARGIAEAHFYCDDKCRDIWSPFEDWHKEEVKQECRSLAENIYNAMLWARDN